MSLRRRSILIVLLSFACFALQYNLSAILAFVHLSTVLIRLLPFVFIGFALGTLLVLRYEQFLGRSLYVLPWAGTALFSAVFLFFNYEPVLVLLIPLLFACVYAPIVALLVDGSFRTNYFADLLGGATGFLFAFLGLGFLSAEWIHICILTVLGIIPLIIFWNTASKRLLALVPFLVSGLLLVGQGVYHGDILDALRSVELSNNPYPLNDAYNLKNFPNVEHVASRWSPISRVDIVRVPTSWGDTALYYNRIRWSSLVPYRKYNPSVFLFKKINPDAKNAIVIGVGGGTDIDDLEKAGFPDITGVEINDATFALLSGPFASLAKNVYINHKVYLAEGRSFLEHEKEKRYDAIILPSADLYFADWKFPIFFESYLYSVEALQLYWDRLSNNGIISISRRQVYTTVEGSPEMYTLLLTLRSFFLKNGLDPAEHMLVFSDGQPTQSFPLYSDFVRRRVIFIVSKAPLDAGKFKEIRNFVGTSSVHFLSPSLGVSSEPLWDSEKCFVDAFSNPSAECLSVNKPSVITDDRPFFWSFGARDIMTIFFKNATTFIFLCLAALLLVVAGTTAGVRDLYRKHLSLLVLPIGLGIFYGLLIPHYYHSIVLVFRSPLQVIFLIQIASIIGCSIASLYVVRREAREIAAYIVTGIALLIAASFFDFKNLLYLAANEWMRYVIVFACIFGTSILFGSAFPYVITEIRTLTRDEVIVMLFLNVLGIAFGTFISSFVTFGFGAHANLAALAVLGIALALLIYRTAQKD